MLATSHDAHLMKPADLKLEARMLDWLSVIKREGPGASDVLCNIISESDRAVCRKHDVETTLRELQGLDSDVSRDLYGHLRVSLEAHQGVLQRQFVVASQNDRPMTECFELFKALSSAGFSCPVEKSRIVVVLLQYLEKRLPAAELRPLVEAMTTELESCRVGCVENLSVLNTFSG